jgi:muconolactone delta-isomerase
MEHTIDYLVKATPTRELLELSAADRDELMAAEREVATDLIAGGAITWMWRLPDTQTSIAIWNAERAVALEAHLQTLPVFPLPQRRDHRLGRASGVSDIAERRF